MVDIQGYLKEEQLKMLLNKYVIHRNHDHEEHVTQLALELFDAFKEGYGFAPEARSLLKYSAVLHDIGYYIDGKLHHKHTKYIILTDHLLKSVPKEIRSMLAIVAGGHRKSIPAEIKTFDRSTQENLLRLIALLRTADVLDHQCVTGIGLQQSAQKKDKLVIHLKKDCQEKLCKKINRKTALLKEKFLLDIQMDDKILAN